MPYALSLGVDIASFWHLTPHSLYLIGQGYNIALKRQIDVRNTMAHLQGRYIAEAILATVGNMFSSKTSKKHEYPEQPYDLDLDGNKTERENEKKLQLFAAHLTNTMNNFNLSKEQG